MVVQVFTVRILTTSSDHPNSIKAVLASSVKDALLLTARRETGLRPELLYHPLSTEKGFPWNSLTTER